MNTTLHEQFSNFCHTQKLDDQKQNFLKGVNQLRKFLTIITILFTFLMGLTSSAYGQYQMENIDRGIIAVKTSDTSVFVSWRLLGIDPDTVAFNVYRNDTKINLTPILNSTNFMDKNAVVDAKYHVVSVLGGIETESSDTVSPWAQNSLTIPLNRPDGGTTPANENYTYSPNDASVGDLDGDGQYEIVLKWDPSNSKDNSQSGYTGNVYLDAYELDGTQLWRIDLGKNIRAGAHYTQFMVYDLDGDGKAEVTCKTAPGTKDGSGNYLSIGPAASDDDSADYRNGSGYILSGPEYLTVFNGLTGHEIVTTNYNPPRGDLASWGDTYGNRVDRFLACIAYLDGQRPSVVMCRGYYTGSGRGRTVLAAWDYRNDTLKNRWTFNADVVGENPTYTGQGNHNISVGDVDGDGKDEIIYGSMAIDDDGSPLWNSHLGHGDAMHLSDIDPDRPGLEVWGIHEQAQVGSALLDAKTGAIIWGTGPADVGRGVAADLDSLHFGMECWGGTDGLRSAKNQKVGNAPSSSNHLIWWDGDLTRELLDGNAITKYGEGILLQASDCSSNNGTKSNPTLTADLFGDWREEAIWRTSDNTALKLFTTTDTTEYRIKTLMHDPVYREGIAWQNVAYNQPPHTGFFLGAGMFTPDSLRPPSAPNNVKATALNDTVKLKWDENLESDLDGYNVYRSKTENGTFEKINTALILQPSFIDTAVFNDTTYFYAITALDTSDNESRYSLLAKAIPTFRPNVPYEIYSRNDVGKIKLFWSPDTTDRITGYNIYRTEMPEGDLVEINTSPVTETEFLDSLLTDNAPLYYVIKSVDDNAIESFGTDTVICTPGPITHLQAEEGNYSGGSMDNNNLGFYGTAFYNFASTSYVEFTDIGGNQGGDYRLLYRYALGNNPRTGNLIVNDVTRNITMRNTAAFTTYIYDSVRITLNAGFTNTIRFASTGSDFGNLDEIIVKPALEPTGLEENNGSALSDISNIYPNPFTDRLTIEYANAESGNVTIQVFNSLGKVVNTLVNGYHTAGSHHVNWNAIDDSGNKVPEGFYFCRMTFNNGEEHIRKIILMNGN